MDFIAQQLPGMSRDLAHGFGLFLHVGMPVLLQSMKGYASTMVEANARIDRPSSPPRTPTTAPTTWLWAPRRAVWNLPPLLMAAVRLHHDFSAPAPRMGPRRIALIAAGLIAEWLMRRHEGLSEDADWAANHAAAMAWLHPQMDRPGAVGRGPGPIFDAT